MKGFLIFIAICIVITLYSSSGSKSSYTPTDSYDTYSTQDDISDDVVTSDNWTCTDDCSGHDAGYEWASDHGITDPDDCGGNSDSFIEGCQAYANEQAIEEENSGDYEYDYSY